MNKILYAAYGSNLNYEQMAWRCPNSEPVGLGMINDYKLCFDVHADIRPERGSCVPVLLWDISDEDWENLDRYEGYPKYYIKKIVKVNFGNQEVDAIVYVMTNGRCYSFPSEDYYFTIVEGYNQNGMDIDFLRDGIYYTAIKMERFNYYKEDDV